MCLVLPAHAQASANPTFAGIAVESRCEWWYAQLVLARDVVGVSIGKLHFVRQQPFRTATATAVARGCGVGRSSQL